MKLIIGGAIQGKKQYAIEKFGVEGHRIIDGAMCEKDAIFQAGMVFHFHEYIRRFLTEEAYLREVPEQLWKENPDVILVTNELGYGIVPTDKFDRSYRELTGRICCDLAKRSCEVHRVVCGIGMVIKHD